jgi:peptidyl-dipeptidase A
MNTDELTQFLNEHTSRLEPLSRDVNLAYWNATISGKTKDFARYADLQVRLQKLHSDKRSFEKLKQWKSDSSISDPNVKRQVELLYCDFLRNQIDPKLNEKITKLASKIENQFNVFRGELNGKKVTSNEILQILKKSTDDQYRQKAWEAGKQVGVLVCKDLITLVKLRNDAAQSLGYDNFYVMSLALAEQNETDILSLFDEVEAQTRGPFSAAKDEIDDILAGRYGISAQEVKPWHYEDPFFQEMPRIDGVNLDRYYENHDILELVKSFYRGIGLDVEDILARSDLFEKHGKLQHAYCTDIDRKGDIRILANIKNDENWTGTMLHELGHAVYMKTINPSLPYLLREEAHIFATEAIAMLFGRLSKDAEWIQMMIRLTDGEKDSIANALKKNLRLSQLLFSRWCQVMVHFEHELYSDPDQDLNRLWWDLAMRYQQLKAPPNTQEKDWASKVHIVSAPVYYHNYLLGEFLASQLDHHIRHHVIHASAGSTPYYNRKELGEYLKDNIFRSGALYRWDRLIQIAMGEKLTSRYFVQQFVR